MDGPSNNNTRSDWYDIVHPRVSPIFSRDEKSHTDRRRVWNRALSMKGETPHFVPQMWDWQHTSASSYQRIPTPDSPANLHAWATHRDIRLPACRGERYHAMVCVRFYGRICLQWKLQHDEIWKTAQRNHPTTFGIGTPWSSQCCNLDSSSSIRVFTLFLASKRLERYDVL